MEKKDKSDETVEEGGEGPQRDLGRTTLGHGRNGKELDGGSRDADKAVREKRKGKE